MEIRAIRHATMLIEINGKTLLVDPMLSPKGTLDAIPDVPNTNKNPLTNLPVDADTLTKVDAVLVSHTHRDHFDSTAIEKLPKDILIFGQPPDAGKLTQNGFTNLRPIENSSEWNNIEIIRTDGQHGTGEIGREMGPVSGFVLRSSQEPALYIVGDSIFCADVKEALDVHKPDITICFAGAAQFSHGDPITMTKQDISRLAKHAPYTKVIVVHMESWNHCALSRQELKHYIDEEGLSEQVYIPIDGEILAF